MPVITDTNILNEAQRYVRDIVSNITQGYNADRGYGYYNIFVYFSNRLSRRYGYCRTYRDRCHAELYFSNMYLKACWNEDNKEALKEVVIHEVAHAICRDKYGYGHGHDKYFREVVYSLGGSLTQRSSNMLGDKYKPYRYLYKCPNCGRVIKSKRKRNGACAKCCNEFNNGKYTDKYVWILVEDKGRVENWK